MGLFSSKKKKKTAKPTPAAKVSKPSQKTKPLQQVQPDEPMEVTEEQAEIFARALHQYIKEHRS